MIVQEMQRKSKRDEKDESHTPGTAERNHRTISDPVDVQETNFRVLELLETKQKHHFFIPKELTLDLLFFRQIFVRLRESEGDDKEEDDNIPVATFQRALERLFYVLRETPFDATTYDSNSNGYVGWSEFCTVFKERNISIRLSFLERLHFTLDSAGPTSTLTQIVSNIVLVTIFISSTCFVLSTVPECRQQPSDDPDEQPEPAPIFEKIELMCLIGFVVEYALRLLSCWAVRAEVFNKAALLDLTTGMDLIQLPSPMWRLWLFVRAPSNVIDLAAILPGVIALFPQVGLSGGGFVVLRLIRLTRVVKALSYIKGPAIVIARTIQQSEKELYVLGFNLMLGVVIAGSLMWVAEGGTWNRNTHTYERVVGRQWNHTEFIDLKEESPFLSIPHSFWWAIVTATTVGYGDQYPTTAAGKLITTVFMLFSLVVLALPVGVIGSTFGQEWDNYEKKKALDETLNKEAMNYLRSSKQRIEPGTMKNILLIEVWNERIVSDTKGAWGFPREGNLARPHPAEFMGQASLELELPPQEAVVRETVLHLAEDPDTVRRQVRGSICVKYEWSPQQLGKRHTEQQLERETSSCIGFYEPLWGILQVTVISGDGLINLHCSSIEDTASNPYCTVLCYPTSPQTIGEAIQPCIWRTPTCNKTLSPKWHASTCFDFCWLMPNTGMDHQAMEMMSTGDDLRKTKEFNEPIRESKSDLHLMLEQLTTEVRQVRGEMRILSSRVGKLNAEFGTVNTVEGYRPLGQSTFPLDVVPIAPRQAYPPGVSLMQTIT